MEKIQPAVFLVYDENKEYVYTVFNKPGIVFPSDYTFEPYYSKSTKHQRITEQDARELVEEYFKWNYRREFSDTSVDIWLAESEGRTLLAKLNEHREDYKAMADELLEATKAVTNLAMLHVGYNNKIVDKAIQAIAQCEGQGTSTEDGAGILIRPRVKLE